MRLFSRLPHRRFELLFALCLFLALIILQWLVRAQELGSGLTLSVMELILPVLLGILTSGLLADDPMLELLLCMPRPAHHLLLERSLVILGLGSFLGLELQVLASAWGIYLPFHGIRMAFTWLSPMMFYVGLAGCFALLRGRMLDGVIACLAAGGASLLSIPLITSLCGSATLEKGCPTAIFFPIMTSSLPFDPYWPVNRVFWLIIGASLLGISGWLTRQGERLIPLAPTE